MDVVSLFSGCGGLDLGLQGNFTYLRKDYGKQPFKILFANDNHLPVCDTYDANFKRSITRTDIVKFLENNSVDLPDSDIVVGGFPCQDFSLCGKHRLFQTGRGRLYRQIKKVVTLKNPKAFMVENVYGLILLGALEPIKRELAKAGRGYEVTHHVVLAADYGVPQMRQRVFIVGVRKDLKVKFQPPKSTHSDTPTEGQLPWVTTEEAIGNIEGKENQIPNHNQYSKAIFYKKKWQGNSIIKPNKPSPTIRAYHHGNIQFHYKGHRRLTVRECARLQSFPDNFIFTSSTAQNYISVGNAVPPVLGWHFARALAATLKEI